jgi:hypothetical protein
MSHGSEVAKTILSQLGGNRFVTMTGAKNFASHGDECALSFRIASTMTENKCNHVKITLNSSDLYDVTFSKIFKLTVKEISKHNDLYAEDLVNLFESETGLYTHL